MIVIVDSGGANLVSISSAITRLGQDVRVSTSPQEIEEASHVILPGVGSSSVVMERLKRLRLIDTLKALSQPVLGICVGMHILFEFSEEGSSFGLGILRGKVQKLPEFASLSLPHMGWNTLKITDNDPLLRGISEAAYVYFVHNYAASVGDYTKAETAYGLPFSAVVRQDNWWGVQFHPERSGTIGQQLLNNFLEQSA